MNRSNEELLREFKWGLAGENQFSKFMSEIRKQIEEKDAEIKELKLLVKSLQWDLSGKEEN